MFDPAAPWLLLCAPSPERTDEVLRDLPRRRGRPYRVHIVPRCWRWALVLS